MQERKWSQQPAECCSLRHNHLGLYLCFRLGLWKPQAQTFRDVSTPKCKQSGVLHVISSHLITIISFQNFVLFFKFNLLLLSVYHTQIVSLSSLILRLSMSCNSVRFAQFPCIFCHHRPFYCFHFENSLFYFYHFIPFLSCPSIPDFRISITIIFKE